jgi:hypothetical protein
MAITIDINMLVTLGMALRSRREELIKGWISSYAATKLYGQTGDDLEHYQFWAKELDTYALLIRNVNDAYALVINGHQQTI